MRGLMIEFDLTTGKRAGDINNKDPNLLCHGWQDLSRDPALEIRLVEDDRDLSSLVGVPGVTILEDRDAINAAITANIPIRYVVKDKELLLAHLKDRGISLDTLSGMTLDMAAKDLYDAGLGGIVKREPRLV
jgi:hypothetical protein